MQKIRKNDLVQIIKGKDRGKRGKLLGLTSDGRRAYVEGLNLVKKHKRQSRQDQKGGIVSIEAPLSIANLMLYCKNCQRATRVGISFLEDKSKVRICKLCKQTI
jgi:large subunit ribosomal protein L24